MEKANKMIESKLRLCKGTILKFICYLKKYNKRGGNKMKLSGHQDYDGRTVSTLSPKLP